MNLRRVGFYAAATAVVMLAVVLLRARRVQLEHRRARLEIRAERLERRLHAVRSEVVAASNPLVLEQRWKQLVRQAQRR